MTNPRGKYIRMVNVPYSIVRAMFYKLFVDLDQLSGCLCAVFRFATSTPQEI